MATDARQELYDYMQQNDVQMFADCKDICEDDARKVLKIIKEWVESNPNVKLERTEK